MRPKQKILSLFLSFALLCAMVLPAHAADPEITIIWLPEEMTPADPSFYGSSNLLCGFYGTFSGFPTREVKKGDPIAVQIKTEKGLEFGYINTSGELIAQLDPNGLKDLTGWWNWQPYDTFLYSEGLLPVPKLENGTYQTTYVNAQGKEMFTLENTYGFSFEEGVAIAVQSDEWGSQKYGVIDTKGNTVIPFEYDGVASSGFANGPVGMGKNSGDEWEITYFTKEGNPLALEEYDNTIMFVNGFAIVCKDKKYGLIDAQGQLTLPLEYDDLDFDSSTGLFEATKNDKVGLIAPATGTIVVQPMDKETYQQNHQNQFYQRRQIGETSVIRVAASGKIAYFYPDGSLCDDPYQGRLQWFIHEGKYGLKNAQGDVVVEPQYDEISPYNADDLIAAVKAGKLGFLDPKTGQVVIPFDYDYKDFSTYSYSRFISGLAVVSKDGQHGFINDKGQTVIPFELDGSLYRFSNRLIMNGAVGMVSRDGRYGIFENPYFKAGLSPLSVGSSSGGTLSPGGFPVLPAAGAALLLLAGGGLFLAKRKKQR